MNTPSTLIGQYLLRRGEYEENKCDAARSALNEVEIEVTQQLGYRRFIVGNRIVTVNPPYKCNPRSGSAHVHTAEVLE